jgi:arsenate reductase
LEENNCEVEIVEYLKDAPGAKTIKEIVKMIGIKPEDLVRKNEQLYKDNFSGKKFSDSEWIKILSENPILIERPIIIKDGKAVIGRPPVKVMDLI